jgi:threonine dehydratase
MKQPNAAWPREDPFMTDMQIQDISPPSLDAIRDAIARLGDRIRHTPVWQLRGDAAERELGRSTQAFFKLELLQYAGTFKPRGALLNILALTDEARARGVTAFSAGNHAIATAYAAQATGSHAKVVMPRTASPYRIGLCRAYGADVVLVDDGRQAFEEAKHIESDEGRALIHPFEGPLTVLGTATVGYELGTQAEALDAVIVPIGGGGLCAGVASAIKQLQPNCQIFGVEPEGADAMHRSFAVGTPQALERANTIADSLAAPHTAPYSFGLCKRYVDALVHIDDHAMQRAMGFLFATMKLAVEPAAAAATAALCGPLRERLEGRRVGIIVCGSNIDPATFTRQVIPYAPGDTA